MRRLILAPILLAAMVSFAVPMQSIILRLMQPYPATPWESGIIVDACRIVQGEALYGQSVAERALGMYGPLGPYVVGLVFAVTGPNLYVPRAISLFSALLLGMVLLMLFTPRRVAGGYGAIAFYLIVGAGLYLAMHYRARAYFVEARPDMASLLFAALAVVLFYRAVLRQRNWCWAGGCACLIVGLLFKQTAAIAAVVPLAAVLMGRSEAPRGWPPLLRQLALCCIPIAVVLAVVGALHVFHPVMYYFMIEMPAMYTIDVGRLTIAATELFLLNPLFIVLLAVWLTDRHGGEQQRSRVVWLLAAVIVTAPVSILSFSKRGGTYNSLLFTWVPMTALCIALLPLVIERIKTWTGAGAGAGAGGADRLKAMTASVLVAALVVATLLAVPRSQQWAMHQRYNANGGPQYARIIEQVRTLEGKVVCPDDPTIPLLARGYAGRTLDYEVDATGRRGIPVHLRSYMQEADWLVRVHGIWDHSMPQGMEQQLGFERVELPPFDGAYSLWRAKRQAQPGLED